MNEILPFNHNYIKFLPRVSGQLGVDNLVLMLYGGHESHIDKPLVKWARAQHFIHFVLPTHNSHILQTLDVGIFGPLKYVIILNMLFIGIKI